MAHKPLALIVKAQTVMLNFSVTSNSPIKNMEKSNQCFRTALDIPDDGYRMIPYFIYLGASMLQLLFGFKGRLNRGQYVVALIIGYVLPFVLILSTETYLRQNGLDILGLALVVFLFWVLFAGLAKRFHDINKSGWMALTIFVPIIGQFIPFIMLFWPGDKTDNDFGSSKTYI